MESKIILITHQKGGVGKSTLAFNLARILSQNSKVAVLDFDSQGSLAQIKEMVTGFDILAYEGEINKIHNLNYDFILIDTPPYLSNRLPDLIELANLIIIPTKAGILDLLAVKSTIELLKNKKSDALIVFNMIKPNTTLTQDILNGIKEYEVPVAKTYISDLVSFTRSVLIGDVSADKNATNQINSLAIEILSRLV